MYGRELVQFSPVFKGGNQMSKRTMIKLSASEDYIYLRTLSEEYRSPQGFTITDKELAEMEEKGYKVISDIHSFAKLSLRKTMDGTDVLVINFTWLSDTGGGMVSGREETVLLSYKKFQEYVGESRKNHGEQKKLLSLDEKPRPKIALQSSRNLKAVAEKKLLRKKLGKVLWQHFAWKGSKQITVYDDFEPYSFFFQEQTPYGTGMCGGVILHGRENLKKAYYGIHT